jgi:hypothetical protein
VSRRGTRALSVALFLALSVAFCAGVPTPGRGSALAAGARAPSVEIRVIHATRVDGGTWIDPRLRDLPQLTRQEPFVRYNVFELIDRTQRSFESGKPLVYPLVDGRTLQVTLVEPANPKNSDRYHLRAEIAGLGRREFLKLLEVTAGADEPFFVGGQIYDRGTLFLEIVVRA